MSVVNSIEEIISRVRAEVGALNNIIRMNAQAATKRELLLGKGHKTTDVHEDISNILSPIDILTSGIKTRLEGIEWTAQAVIRPQPELGIESFSIDSTGIHISTNQPYSPFSDFNSGDVVFLAAAKNSTNNGIYRTVAAVVGTSGIVLTTDLNKGNTADTELTFVLKNTTGW